MSSMDLKSKLNNIIDAMPDDELKEILDFAAFIKERSIQEGFLNAQMNSKQYQEWVSPENDIYDEVFND